MARFLVFPTVLGNGHQASSMSRCTCWSRPTGRQCTHLRIAAAVPVPSSFNLLVAASARAKHIPMQVENRQNIEELD